MAGPIPPQSQKLCPSCGAIMPAQANVCSNCGYNFNTGPYSQPPAPLQANPHYQVNYPRDGYGSAPASADGFGIAGFVVGLLSLGSFCCFFASIPLGLAALGLGVPGLKGRNRALAIAGMICGGIGLLGSVIMFIFTLLRPDLQK